MALLVAVIRMIEFFQRFKRLKFIVDVLAKSSESVAWFSVIFLTLFVGFALCGHVMFGIEQPAIFGSVWSGMCTLGLWSVALGGGHEDLFNLQGGDIYIGLFLLIMMILIFNFFITIIMGAYDDVQGDEEKKYDEDGNEVLGDIHKPVNYIIADWICDRFCISSFHDDPYSYDASFMKIRDEADEEKALLEESA
jgi:hypothetical protein